MIFKNFDGWNLVKKDIHFQENTRFFHEREVWWCALGVNVGHEQDGKGEQFLRPIIVIKKFGRNVCVCVPVTKQIKKGPFYFSLFLNGVLNNAILSQIRLIDVRRFKYKIGNISQEDFENIKEKLMHLFA
ncbi:MAG: type II toxin-antitoxin system PemK/MazF family toxin [Patescibacteria group bacterium]